MESTLDRANAKESKASSRSPVRRTLADDGDDNVGAPRPPIRNDSVGRARPQPTERVSSRMPSLSSHEQSDSGDCARKSDSSIGQQQQRTTATQSTTASSLPPQEAKSSYPQSGESFDRVEQGLQTTAARNLHRGQLATLRALSLASSVDCSTTDNDHSTRSAQENQAPSGGIHSSVTLHSSANSIPHSTPSAEGENTSIPSLPSKKTACHNNTKSNHTKSKSQDPQPVPPSAQPSTGVPQQISRNGVVQRDQSLCSFASTVTPLPIGESLQRGQRFQPRVFPGAVRVGGTLDDDSETLSYHSMSISRLASLTPLAGTDQECPSTIAPPELRFHQSDPTGPARNSSPHQFHNNFRAIEAVAVPANRRGSEELELEHRITERLKEQLVYIVSSKGAGSATPPPPSSQSISAQAHESAPYNVDASTEASKHELVVAVAREQSMATLFDRWPWHRIILLVLLFVVVVIGTATTFFLLPDRGSNNAAADTDVPSIVQPPSMTPSTNIVTNRADDLRAALGESVPENEINDADSPSYMAIKWLVEEDSYDWGDLTTDEKKERFAAVQFYFTLDGDEWSEGLQFLTPTSICDWNNADKLGIFCNSNLSAQNMTFSPNGLGGTLNGGIALLSNLEYLDLAENKILGYLPTELGLLTQLKRLRMDGNLIDGSIPSEIGQLSLLEDLLLGANILTGSIPSEIGNLDLLSTLGLYANFITYSLPSEIGNLELLSILYLDTNKLTGSLPTEVGRMASLEICQLLTNSISGSMPSEIGNLQLLEYLDMDGNGLTGSLPSELGKVTSLYFLDLRDNNMRSNLPPEMGQLVGLRYLYLQGNSFDSSVPIQFADLMMLEYVSLHNNLLTGNLDPAFCAPRLSRLSSIRADCIPLSYEGPETPETTCSCCDECCGLSTSEC